MTTTNIFARLKQMLPAPALLIGKILELHPDDDTSTVQLLMAGSTTQTYDEALKTGNIIRARGQFVPVGQNAFVRNGVIETKAPDEVGGEIVVGRIVTPADPLTFSPDIGDRAANTGVPFSLAVASHWHGGVAPLRYSIGSGALPAGLSVDVVNGIVSGTPSTAGASTLTLRATDASATYVDSDTFDLVVALATGPLVVGRFNGTNGNNGTLGGAFTITSQGALSTAQHKYGTGSLRIIPDTVSSGIEQTNVCTIVGAPLAVPLGTKKTLSAWVFVAAGGPDPAFVGACVGIFGWFPDASGTSSPLLHVTINPLAGGATFGIKAWSNNSNSLNPTEATASTGAWHHVAVTVDESNVVRWFVDGVLQTGTRTLTAPTTGGAVIVAHSAGNGPDIYVDGLYFASNEAAVADFTPPGEV